MTPSTVDNSKAVRDRDIPSFGREIRDIYFMFDPTSISINHGSWGGVPKPVWDARIKKMTTMEFQVDTFFRRALEKDWFSNLRAAAKFLGSKEENLVFVENATSGVNTVAKSLDFKEGDAILVNSRSYYSCQNACKLAGRRAGASIVTQKLEYPIKSKDNIIDSFRKSLDDNPHVKIALIDLISSPTAVQFPVKEMIDVCKSHGVLALVDGAHGPGQVEINLEDLGAHFFTGNLHKWMYTPRVCAILWVHPTFHKEIKPLVTSANLDYQDFRYDFYYQATRDYTPYLCVEEALTFYQQIVGLSVITDYTNSLLEKATDHLVKVWGTEEFPIPKDLRAPNLRMVRLPALPAYPIGPPQNVGQVFDDYKSVMHDLFNPYNVNCTCLVIQGEPWLRLSANVYNSINEYEKLGQYILELKENTKSN